MTHERFDELRANALSDTCLICPNDVLECLEEISRLAAMVYVPGQFKCPVCGFVLTKSILYAKSGTIGAEHHCDDECPNDGSAMLPTTWEDDARAMAKRMPDARAMELIHELRAEEGSSVTILCDNPEGEGDDNAAVQACGEWTGWNEKRFSSNNVLAALWEAVHAKDKVGGE